MRIFFGKIFGVFIFFYLCKRISTVYSYSYNSIYNIMTTLSFAKRYDAIAASILLALLLLISPALQAQTAPTADSLAADTLKTLDLRGVTVTGNRDRMDGDKRTIRFKREDRKRAATLRDLLDLQGGFAIDHANKGALTYFGLKKIIYTVDGIEKGDGPLDMQHLRFSRVEVRQFPGGKYQEYDVWVNIITDPDYIGYEGNLWVTPTTHMRKHAIKDNSDISGGGYMTYQNAKWTVTLQANELWQKGETDVDTDVKFNFTDIYWETFRTPDSPPSGIGINRSWHANFSTDYRISEKSSASFVYDYNGSNNWKLFRADIRQTSADGMADLRDSQRLIDKQNTHSFALFYRNHEHAVKFNTDINYRFTPSKSTDEHSRTPSYEEKYYLRDNLRFLRYNLDAETRLADERLVLTAGYVLTWKSYKRRDDITGQQYNKNGYLRNKFWAKAWMRWNCGLQTAASLWTETVRLTNNGTSQTQKPPFGGTVELFMPLKNGAWTRFDYNCSVSYPDRSGSQDWGYYQDSLTWVHGNPYLRSSTVHHFTYKLDLWRAFNIAAGFNYAPNQIEDIIQRANIGGREMVESTSRNVLWKEWWGALSLSKDLGKGFFYKADASASRYYSKYADFTNKGYALRFSTSINYWCKPINTDFSLWYSISHTGSVKPQYKTEGDSECPGAEIRHKALKNRLIVALRTEFLFHFLDNTQKTTSDTPYMTQHLYDYNYRQNAHQISLNVRWMFSGGKSVNKYNKEMSDEQ